MFIKEVFYSFQGEGLFIGYPQIFVRFFGCNISCAYCDEPDFRKDKKKVSLEDVLVQVNQFASKPVHSVSITGGEPLLQPDAIKELVPHLKWPAYLETNGTLPDRLAEVVDLFSYYAVDFKPGFANEFFDFMQLLKGRPNVFVKYILLRHFPIEEIIQAAKMTAAINPSIPFVIQPVTPFSGIKEKASPDDIFRAYNAVRRHLEDVRIIPQTHKFMGLQ